MLAIYKKELRAYFTSMIGYVFIAFFLVIIGLYFFGQNLYSQSANFEYTLSAVTFIFVLMAPLLTMRLMAEEKKQKTDQLLYTSPLTATSIVIGKFLAVFSVFLIVMVIISFYPLILSLYGEINFAPAYAGIFGFALLGAAYLAMGLFISSLTESQVVAAVISFIVFLITVLMDSLASIIPTDNQTAFIVFTIIIAIICIITYLMTKNITLTLAIGVVGEGAILAIYLWKPTLFDGAVIAVFEWLSVNARYSPFYYGIFDLSAVVYYISIAFLFIFLTIQSIKKKRWS